MTFETKITLRPTVAQLQKQLARKISALRDWRLLNRQVSVKLFQWVERNFKTEGKQLADPAWPPLKAGGRWKKLPGGKRTFDPSAKVLQDTGLLRQSFSPPYYDSKMARVAAHGEREPVADKHHFGRNGLPQRQLVPRKDQVIGDILRIANAHANKAARK